MPEPGFKSGFSRPASLPLLLRFAEVCFFKPCSITELGIATIYSQKPWSFGPNGCRLTHQRCCAKTRRSRSFRQAVVTP